ncbi:MAG: leucine-rich repeat protein [Bacteroidales bacterium]|nr:leucine-rich repeat protein [Bacteroidales bacterium]
MKVKHLIFSYLAVVGLLTSCFFEPDFEPIAEGGIPILVDGSVSQIATKVNAQGFEDGDALGIYAVNYENSNQTPGTLLDEGNQVDHVKYVFDEDSWKWNPVRSVYYKDMNTNIDLYAFYPFAEPSSVSAYNFEVQKDQSTAETSSKLAGYEASDFLWGKTENVTPTESAIKVKLQHKMAGVNVILEQGTGFDEAGDWNLLDKKVLVTGTTRKAAINLATGEVTPVGGAQATGIVMAPQSDGTFRAIAVPQVVQAGTALFNITIGGVTYKLTKDAAFTYEAGKLNKFTITINRKYPSGEYEFVLTDTQIVNWKEDLNTHEGEARQYYCVNCTEPGTLGRLIKADKKNPDKIKNLKVSGKISDEDFYFMRDSMAILEAVNLKECKVVEVGTGEAIWGTLPNGEWGIIGYTKVKNDVIPSGAFSGKESLYYFTFPEVTTEVCHTAFSNSSLSGPLVLPDDVNYLGIDAFSHTNITSLFLSSELISISDGAFAECRELSGNISLPDKIEYIGDGAFNNCSLSGKLFLPNSLTYIGNSAFREAGKFSGDLRIPDKVKTIYDNTFTRCGFSGVLDLNNVTSIGIWGFADCKFQGELIIPENTTAINHRAFANNNFSSITFPSSLKVIDGAAFEYCDRLGGILSFPEGMVTISDEAFNYCRNVNGIELPSTLQSIGEFAFRDCFYIHKITSYSVEPPIIQYGAFDGVPKDNFIVEVPANAVKRYQADAQWGEFKRIAAHYDFSISRPLSRSLNAETSKTYVLRAPANHDWSIESRPDWVTVTPSSGTGKTEVTVTFAEMTEAEVGTFDAELTDEWGNYQGTATYVGRTGEIVFLLNDKDYRHTMTVEQYDYEYGDGDVMTLNTATKGGGVDLVFMGDCYDARDIASGDYLKDIQEAFGYYFDVEPYKTYKDYFNVYAVFGVSNDSGMGTVNTIRDAKFGSQYSLEGISPDFETAYNYAKKADSGIDSAQTLVVLIENTTEYGGITYMWGDGSAIACCPKSADAYPYDFRGIVQHEAGGHGFGKLADEYIYHNAFIQSCTCPCCDHLDGFLKIKALGWYRNLEVIGDVHQVGWSHLIFNPQYSDYVDVFEGGYSHIRGVYRSEATSCMNNNIPYYSAISRQAIVERIMDYAGEEFTLENFYANDSDEFGTTTRSGTISLESMYNNGKQYAPVYMGDKPDFI